MRGSPEVAGRFCAAAVAAGTPARTIAPNIAPSPRRSVVASHDTKMSPPPSDEHSRAIHADPCAGLYSHLSLVRNSSYGLAAMLIALVAGCGGSDRPQPAPPPPTQRVIQPGAPGEPSRAIVATPTARGLNAKHVDAEFMMGMIHHHQQAVVMADW